MAVVSPVLNTISITTIFVRTIDNAAGQLSSYLVILRRQLGGAASKDHFVRGTLIIEGSCDRPLVRISALPSEGRGRRFESFQVRHKPLILQRKVANDVSVAKEPEVSEASARAVLKSDAREREMRAQLAVVGWFIRR